ncbi:MAG: DUF5009 domain-containing protein [Planctomycetota bacterium]|nr:DUF5009 domain-containing protein [Planctomycetota bacterium]
MNSHLKVEPAERLVSLDALRGYTMLLMASSALGVSEVARQFPESGAWGFLSYHFSHDPWRGGGLWDMIQPFFTFMVGVSMAYSYARRSERGQSYRRMLGHALYRSFVLVALGVLLRSRWTFEDVLAQMGLGYVFLFLLWRRRARWVLASALGILVAYWALFALWPLPGPDHDHAAVDVSSAWMEEHGFTGFAAHWNKNANPAHYFDRWFLNLLPQNEPFVANRGGYHTLSFIPSLATMILGLLAGELLRSSRSPARKLRSLVAWGTLGLAAGVALDWAGICPIVKRIWTPSWTLYSGGWALLTLAGFYGAIDILRFRAWAWPGVVVGLNSIALYVLSKLITVWVDRTIRGICGQDIYSLFNHTVEAAGDDGSVIQQTIRYDPLVHRAAVLFVLWLICWGMYRRKMFVRI